MSHERHEESLLLFLDGEAPAEEPAEFERHLQDCPRCRVLREAADLFASLKPELYQATPSERFGRLVLEEVRAGNGRPAVTVELTSLAGRRRTGWQRWVALAASLVLVVCLWLVGRQSPQPLVVLAEGVRLESPGGRVVSLIETTTMKEGARLATGPDGVAVVVVAAGNELRVGPDSDLTLERLGSRPHFRLESGRVWVTEDTVEIVITTGELKILPVGTVYEVRVDGPRRVIKVHEGQVRVESRDGKRLILGAGKQLDIRSAVPWQLRPLEGEDRWSRFNKSLRLPSVQGPGQPLAPAPTRTPDLVAPPPRATPARASGGPAPGVEPGPQTSTQAPPVIDRTSGAPGPDFPPVFEPARSSALPRPSYPVKRPSVDSGTAQEVRRENEDQPAPEQERHPEERRFEGRRPSETQSPPEHQETERRSQGRSEPSGPSEVLRSRYKRDARAHPEPARETERRPQRRSDPSGRSDVLRSSYERDARSYPEPARGGPEARPGSYSVPVRGGR